MVLENFKSYAGTQEIGPFHKCFTAVVGPNGSGKCLAPETLVLMADASVRRADEILPGDMLVGDDGRARVVMSTTRGAGRIFRVVGKRSGGLIFRCNDKHMLVVNDGGTLRTVAAAEVAKRTASGLRAVRAGVDEFPLPFDMKRRLLLLPAGEVAEGDAARFLGARLAGRAAAMAAGSARLDEVAESLGVGRGGVPRQLFASPRDVRLGILSGFIGALAGVPGHSARCVAPDPQTARDVALLARSLGLRATCSADPNGAEVSILPHGGREDDDEITVEEEPDDGEYCGFQLGMFTTPEAESRALLLPRASAEQAAWDMALRTGEVELSSPPALASEKDGRVAGRFLLADFTVTHNSNVLDALLFVFGKRAKQIRQKKVGELVHHSAAHPDLTSASVTVHFREVVDEEGEDDGTGTTMTTRVMPGSEIVLKRTATKTNKSNYYVNGRAATFTEVTDLLKAKGVDLENNRFLILQGEVEQIAMMPPKATGTHDEGMLEYLEDIIGTKRYIELIEGKTRELDKVQEERTEKLNWVKLAAKEKAGLEAAKLEAEDFLGKEKEIIRRKAVIAQLQRLACEQSMQGAVARKNELAEHLRQERERLSESDKRLREVEQAFKRAAKENERMADEMAKAKADLAAFQRQDVQLREDAKHLRSQEKKLRQAIADEEERAASHAANAKRASEEHDAEVARAAEARTELAEEERKLDELYEGLKGDTGPLQERMEARQRELMPSQTKLQELEARRTVLASELELLNGAEVSRRAQVERARTLLEELRVGEEAAAAELGRVAAALRDRKHQLGDARRRAADLARDEQRAAEEVRALRARVEELRAASSAARSRGAVFEAVMALKASKAVRGIHGRLGDLGVINAKYDVAVTTACGALDNIVVQTTEAAQRCVEHLRKGNVGRATFVILDEVSASEHVRAGLAQEFEAPHGSRRLFDLLTFSDEKFRPAFYWALSDTLVVQDLEAATRTAFGEGQRRRRVVTLQGELIEAQGTMSGGGKSVARGGMRTTTAASGSSSSRATAAAAADGEDGPSLQDQEAALAKAVTQFERAREARAAADAEVAALEALSDTTTAKLEMDIAAKRQQRAEVERQLSEAESQPALTDEQERRAAEVRRLVAECEDKIAATRRSTEALEAEIEQIKGEIMKAGGSRLREQKEKVAGLAEDLSKAERAATKCAVEVRTLEKSAEKSKAVALKAQAELAAALKRLEGVRGELAALDEKALGVTQACDEAKKAAQQKAEEAKQQQAQLDALKSERSKAAGVEAGIQEELEECAKQLAERQHAARSFAKQLADLAAAWRGVEESLLAGSEEEGGDASVPAPAPAPGSDPMAEAAAAAEAEAKAEGKGRGGEPEPKLRKKKKDAESGTAGSWDPFRVMSAEELEGYDAEGLRVEIGALEEAKNKLSPNMSAIRDYRNKERQHAARLKELEEATAARDRLKEECESLRKRRLDEFMEGFEAITLKLKEMYRMITVGGDAELELVDRLNPFSEGVVFSVRPAKKSWKNIANLSGGEKTLSSLALVFALHHYKPTPIYVMDEIDAALDFRNVSIVANYIKERTRGAQFVVVSLRNYMFELADRLVGIFKVSDCTESITISPGAYSLQTPAEEAPK